MRPLYGYSDQVAAFVAEQLGASRGFGECQALGFLDAEGALVAGVVYHNWSPEAGVIEISAATLGRRWGTKDRWSVLFKIFSYPFDEIGCQMVVGRTSEHNPAALRIWRRLGADEYRIPRLRGPEEAEILTTLTVEKWRALWVA